MKRVCFVGILFLASLAIAGCNTGPKIQIVRDRKPLVRQVPIVIKLDAGLAGQQILVDVIGATISDNHDSINVDQYWRENSSARKVLSPKSVVFKDTLSAEISDKDEIWSKWKARGVARMTLIAFLPTGRTSGEQGKDGRLTTVSLDSRHYQALKKLEFTITEGGIRVDTPPIK